MHTFTPVEFDPFAEDREIEKLAYTNEPQKEMWLACLLGGQDANLSYNESVSLEITGDLDITAFTEAVNQLALRHEALRSTISPNGEVLIIYREVPVNLTLIDIADLTEIEKRIELDGFIRHEMDTPLDLYGGPLFRVFMHKTGQHNWLFTIIKHHIIGDGWSTGIMLEDLSKLYNAYSKGLDIVLNAPAQISDYASWQATYKQTAAYHDTETYWFDLYKDGAPVLDLPTDRQRRSPRSFKGYRIDRPLPNDLSAQVKTMGAKSGASLVTTLLAAFEVLLYQTTKQTGVVVGLPASGQAASGLTDVVGHCVNLLPLLSHIPPAASFDEYLKKRKKEVLDAYDHQQLTFGELIRKLYIPRDAARIPLVPVIFNIDMGMDNAVVFDGLEFKLISNPRAYENFELYLNATRSKDGIVLEWSYNIDLFNADTIQALHDRYITILETVVADPATRIASLSGKQESVVDINAADEVFIDEDKNLITLFEATVNKYADKTAVHAGQLVLTYGDLNKQVNQLCAFLIESGIGKGDIVALAVDRSLEMVVSLLAILKAGAAYLPLDPAYPADRINFMLADSAAKMLLVSQAHEGKFETTENEIVIDELWPYLGDYSNYTPKASIAHHDVAYVIYTSGSTGKPKGVKLSHLNLINFLLSMQKVPGIVPADKLLAVTTISFDIAGLELYLPLITGAELVIADAETARDGRLLLNVIAEKEISLLQATPSTWQMLIDSGLQKVEGLKALSGGEPLSRELADKLLPLTASLWNMYGPTETTIWSTLKQVLPGERLITVGLPVANTQIYILDDAGNALPAGFTGEIVIGGEGVAQGYLNRPELTAEKFIPDTFSGNHNGRVYRTGDMGKVLENGELQCLGRIDNQVKIRGHRIELGEIESLLAAQPGIKQSVVIAFDDARLNKYLVAFVITDGEVEGVLDGSLTAVWRNELAAVLPDYMVPEEFVGILSFPLTPNGKVDRKAFPKPDRKQQVSKGGALPVTTQQKMVASIFTEVLGITDIKLADDFFALGGHSLLAVKVMVAIEKQTGERLPLATLLSNSTVEKLAAQLAGDKTDDEWDTVVPIRTGGAKPPLFLVHGSGLNLLLFKSISDHFDDEHPIYGVQAIGLTKPADLPETVEAIAAYHLPEILRVQPKGPYAIAGYSYGGFIAYEIAKLLIKTGAEVKFLGMIDTNAGEAMQPEETTARLVKKVTRQFYKAPFIFNSFIKYPKETFAYQQHIIKEKFTKHDPAVINLDVESYTRFQDELRANYDVVINRYRIAPFDIKVSLFRVEKRLYFIDDPKYMGWDKLALKGVKVYTVPGDHNTFRQPPNDKAFADIIQQAMDSGDQ